MDDLLDAECLLAVESSGNRMQVLYAGTAGKDP